MKTTRTFKGSWFCFAVVAAILVGELVAWRLSSVIEFRLNPLTVAFACAGLVALVSAIVFDDAKLE